MTLWFLNSLCLLSWLSVLYFCCSVLLVIWFCLFIFELCNSVSGFPFSLCSVSPLCSYSPPLAHVSFHTCPASGSLALPCPAPSVLSANQLPACLCLNHLIPINVLVLSVLKSWFALQFCWFFCSSSSSLFLSALHFWLYEWPRIKTFFSVSHHHHTVQVPSMRMSPGVRSIKHARKSGAYCQTADLNETNK